MQSRQYANTNAMSVYTKTTVKLMMCSYSCDMVITYENEGSEVPFWPSQNPQTQSGTN